jgi:hypothetical protein
MELENSLFHHEQQAPTGRPPPITFPKQTMGIYI